MIMEDKEIVEKEELMANYLLDLIDSGNLNEESIGDLSYWYLEALRRLTIQMERGKELYLAIKSYLEEINLKKLKKQKKIIVGFIIESACDWCGDEIYWLLEKSNKFVPYIFVMADYDGKNWIHKNQYFENMGLFKDKKLRLKGTLNVETEEQYTWEELGTKPDICIWMTSWITVFKDQFYLLRYPLNTLHTYIPYGFMAAENEREDFVYDQYDMVIHNLAWKIFEESKAALEMAEKYSFLGKSNAVYTGLPKMDKFYLRKYANKTIWDRLLEKAGTSRAKKIIYAPHHTLEIFESVCFSTFRENFQMMLELAEKYQHETVWIFRPHPYLKYKVVQAGVFASIEEWNAYLEKWNQLKNGYMDSEAEYEELLMGSDAMILDSISFLSEYLFTHNPLLFLEGEHQRFNDYGKQLKEIHYCAKGTDEEGIETFIKDIVIAGNDKRKTEREAFFSEKLDYMGANHKTASKAIYDVLMEL